MNGTHRKLPGQTRHALAAVRSSAPAELGIPRKPAESGKSCQNHVRSIVWIETVLAAVAASLAVVTGFYPNWIERVLRIDPDLHSGSTEWNMVIVCAVGAALFAALARYNWRKWIAA
jgi:hypothetical protein